MQNIRMLNLHY